MGGYELTWKIYSCERTENSTQTKIVIDRILDIIIDIAYLAVTLLHLMYDINITLFVLEILACGK